MSRTKAVRIATLLRKPKFDIVDALMVEGPESFYYLLPRAQIHAKAGFEVAMICPSEASWHVSSLLRVLNRRLQRKSRKYRLNDVPNCMCDKGFCCCARCAKTREADSLRLSFVDHSSPCHNSSILQVLQSVSIIPPTLIVLPTRVLIFSLRPSIYNIIQCLFK